MDEAMMIELEPQREDSACPPAVSSVGQETEFLAIVAGGLGPHTWDREVTIKGLGMSMSQAALAIEKEIAGAGGGAITWIEQLN